MRKRNFSSSRSSFKKQTLQKTEVHFFSKCRLRILHVDDDLNQLMFTKIFLEKCDPEITVESVSLPSEAVRALLLGDYDCVVSDYQMEEMDGIALTQRVRQESNVPVIIYTGRGSEEVEEVARAAGADGYMQKETDPSHYKRLYIQICGVIREKMNGIIK